METPNRLWNREEYNTDDAGPKHDPASQQTNLKAIK